MKSDGSAGVSGARANVTDSPWEDADAPLFVSRDKCISVIHGLVTLLLSMDFTCHVDLFIIACKVTHIRSFFLSSSCRSVCCVHALICFYNLVCSAELLKSLVMFGCLMSICVQVNERQ